MNVKKAKARLICKIYIFFLNYVEYLFHKNVDVVMYLHNALKKR